MVARVSSESDAGSVGLDELADDAVLAKELGDREDDVRGGNTFTRGARET